MMYSKSTTLYVKLASIALIGLFSLNSNMVQGQTGYRMGLQISPNIAFMPTTGNRAHSSARTDLGFGLTVSRYFDERYSFNTGVEVPRLQTRLSTADGDTSIHLQASYIQVPLTFKMKTINFGQWTIFARVGGSVGVKFRENTEFVNIESISDEGKNIDPLLLTITGSLGVEYDLGIESHLILSLDFHRSVLNQIDNRKVDFLRAEQPRFSWFAFNVGIIF
jgi:hypothetical protein